MTTIASPKNRLGQGASWPTACSGEAPGSPPPHRAAGRHRGDADADERSGVQEFGIVGFITGTSWNPVKASTARSPHRRDPAVVRIALLISTPIAILTAIYWPSWRPCRVAIPLTFMVELIAAIPSVVIGLWACSCLAAAARHGRDRLEHHRQADLAVRGTTAGHRPVRRRVILAIMILPTIVSVSREVITSVPMSQREAMFALGATRWEVDQGGRPAAVPVSSARSSSASAGRWRRWP
jgi:ABC-type phosphate transport system permease subunit